MAEALGRILIAHYGGGLLTLTPADTTAILAALPAHLRITQQGRLCLGCILQKVKQGRITQ